MFSTLVDIFIRANPKAIKNFAVIVVIICGAVAILYFWTSWALIFIGITGFLMVLRDTVASGVREGLRKT